MTQENNNDNINSGEQPEQPVMPNNSEAVANIINNEKYDTLQAIEVFTDEGIAARALMMVSFKDWLNGENKVRERARQVANQQQGKLVVVEGPQLLVDYTEAEKKELTKTPFIFTLRLEEILRLFWRNPDKSAKRKRGRPRNRLKKEEQEKEPKTTGD